MGARRKWLQGTRIGSGDGLSSQELSRGSITVYANGQKAAAFTLTPEDQDILRQADLSPFIKPGENRIEMELSGEGSLLYQLAGRYYSPWRGNVTGPVSPLSLKVQYER